MKSRILFRRTPVIINTVFLGVWFATCLSATTGQAQQQNVVISDIVAKWMDRQQSIRTFDFAWESDCYALAATVVGPGGKRGDVPESFTFQTKARVILDRTNRVNLQLDRWSWSESEQKLVPSSLHDVFDGQRQTSFFPGGSVPFPDAHTGSGDIFQVVGNQRIVPLRLIYRPFDPILGIVQAAQLTLGNERAMIGDAQMIVLKQAGEREKIIWADPEKNYLPTRYFEVTNGAIKWQFDFTYVPNDAFGWVPSEWKLTWQTPTGDVIESDSAHVTKFELNLPVTDEMFRVDIPAGTYVHDSLTKERYILRDAGEKRHVLKGEFKGNNYAELLATESGELQGINRRPIGLLAMINIVIVIVLAAFVGYRWFRARAE